MGYSFKVSGDPRKPADARKYKRNPHAADEQPPDVMLLLALVCGMLALLLKIKAAAWGALMCCLSSFANMSTIDTDVKQLMSSATFAIFGLVASYLGQPLRAATDGPPSTSPSS